MLSLERRHDPGGGVTVTVERRTRSVTIHEFVVGEGRGHRSRVGVHDPVPAGVDGLHPLRLGAERDARNAG
jgi:hypothetical protein